MSDFSIDLAKAVIDASPHPLAKMRVWLTDSELHCVACYRFGRFAGQLRARNRVAGTLALVLYRLWNRWTTNWHHCDINRRAEIGPGLRLMHRQGVLVGPVTIGSDCLIHHNVTVGERVAGRDRGVPRIGNGVWIGPGAIITGAITIGDGATISAGTVLSKDVPGGCLVGGNPGRVIASDYDNSAFLTRHVRPGGPASPRRAND